MDTSLWGLLLSGFLSSTLLPGGSEAVLLYLQRTAAHDPGALWLAATTGNTLGGMSTWLLGRIVAWRYPGEQLAKPAQQRALTWLQRHGAPVLLLSWLPVVGDPLCLVAGWLRTPWAPALLFIALGKGARYLALLWLGSTLP